MAIRTVTKTYNAGNFKDLNKTLQAKVLNKHRDINTSHDWHAYTEESFKEKLTELGFLDIETYFCISYSQGDGASFTAKHTDGDIECRSSHYCHAYTMATEGSEAHLEHARVLANQYYRDLLKEYEYLTSDEVIAETLEVNEYEFNMETGEIE